MRHLVTTQLLLLVTLLPTHGYPGGSFELVKVAEFQRTGPVSYVLVVLPEVPAENEQYRDPYMGKCNRFTVRGTFSKPWLGGLPKFVTKSSHVDALSYIEKEFQSGHKIRLGWMGGGFKVDDPDRPCDVRSRALYFYNSPGEQPVVISYHDPI